MYQKFTCAALILALTLAACALAETPFGLVPGLNWEDGPEAALELLGPEATLDSYTDMQIIDATIATPLDIEGEPLELQLFYSNDALQMGLLLLHGADVPAYTDAIDALCGAPLVLDENQYWLMDIFSDFTTKPLCYWKVDDKRCYILEEATEQNDDPDIRLLVAVNIQALVDASINDPLWGDTYPVEITIEDMFVTQPEELPEEAPGVESE